MFESDRTAPVESSPLISLSRNLLDRLVTCNASADEYRAVVLVAMMTRRDNSADVAVSEDAFGADPTVLDAGKLDGTPIVTTNWPWFALENAAAHGIILRFSATNATGERRWLLLNTIENAMRVAELVEHPERIPAEYWIDETRPRIHVNRPTVFRLYEQNIGPLTPMIADRLIKALETYPPNWIETAIDEAVAYNRRNWRYVARILENWAAEGPPGRTGRP